MYSEIADYPKRYGQFCRICFTLGNRAKDDDFLIMMSNNYTCLLKEHPVFYQKPKEKVVVFFLCRQDNKSHWQSPDGIKAFTQNFFASHVTIANNCFLRSILDLIRPLIFKLYVFLAKKNA